MKLLIVTIAILVVLSISIIIWYLLSNPMGGPDLEHVDYVDISRFMGEWYVIANIPTFVEKQATNAIEKYELRSDGAIDVTFTFFKQHPGGDRKTFTANAWIVDSVTNAEWKVQFFWPISFPFIIMELADDYRYTVIGVPNRNYLWIMARRPKISEEDYKFILEKVATNGFDTTMIKKVPQEWNEKELGQ